MHLLLHLSSRRFWPCTWEVCCLHPCVNPTIPCGSPPSLSGSSRRWRIVRLAIPCRHGMADTLGWRSMKPTWRRHRDNTGTKFLLLQSLDTKRHRRYHFVFMELGFRDLCTSWCRIDVVSVSGIWTSRLHLEK